MYGQCKISIKPTITVGGVTTIAEQVIPMLFDGDNVVLDCESISHDKKKFYKVRLDLAKVLSPIIERIIKGGKEVTLGMQLLESGKLKIYQISSPEVPLPESTGDDYDTYK
jgi:hypothetical protein